MTREDLLHRLATLESELKNAQKLLEAPAKKSGWWKRFWGRGGYVAAALGMVIVCFLGAGAWGQGGYSRSFYTGNDYLKKDQLVRLGYIAGITDAYWLVAREKAINATLFEKYTKDMTISQIQAIVEKYMKDNPQHWHKTMASAVYVAVTEACGPGRK